MLQSMEYIISDEMQKLLNNFSSLTGVRISFFALDGTELCVGKNRKICGYCAMRRESPSFEEACLADDQQGQDISFKTKDIHFYRCHAGLGQAVMPFQIYEGPVIGYAMIGQFLVTGYPVEALNYNEYQMLEKLPTFTREQLDDLLGMFRVLVNHIVHRALIVWRDVDMLYPLIDRIHRDPAESLTLPEAAGYVGLSASRLSHLFTSTMGVSFKRYQISRRLELADRLFKTNPGWRVARVAKECGFSDPLYFSRVYKDHRGITPSKASRKIANRSEAPENTVYVTC